MIMLQVIILFSLKKSFSKDADIVATGYYTFNNENRKKLKNITIKDENDTSLLNGCAWGKAIKRKFFEHLVFPENYWYEDSIIAHLVVPRANSIYMVILNVNMHIEVIRQELLKLL